MGIRNGDIDFNEVFQLHKQLEQRMEAAYHNSKLPEHADMEKIDRLTREIYWDYLGVDTK